VQGALYFIELALSYSESAIWSSLPGNGPSQRSDPIPVPKNPVSPDCAREWLYEDSAAFGGAGLSVV